MRLSPVRSRQAVDSEYHAKNRPECAAVAYLPDLPRQYLHPFDEAAQ